MLSDEKIKKMNVEDLEDILKSNIPVLSELCKKILDEILERAYMYEDLEL